MNIDQIKEIWNQHLPRLEKAFVEFNWENELVYAQYLSQTYRYISHSCELLKYAAERATNPELRECFLHHIEEETGHEKLALGDLKKLGYTIDQFPELPITRQIYETIYKQIDKHGPASIIGYALALEGLSAKRCPEIAQRLISRYGAAKSTLIKLHGDVDPGHIADSFEVLKLLTDAELAIVAQVVVESAIRYEEYLKDLEAEANKNVMFNGQSQLQTLRSNSSEHRP